MCCDCTVLTAENGGSPTAAILITEEVVDPVLVPVFEYSEASIKDLCLPSDWSIVVGVTPSGLRVFEFAGDPVVGLSYASLIGGVVVKPLGSIADDPCCCILTTEHIKEDSTDVTLAAKIPGATEGSDVYI